MYTDLATFYDNSFRDRFTELMVLLVDRALKELAFGPPAKILDLGCGTGLLAIGLHHLGYTVTGLDLSERMLDIARSRFERDGLPIELLQGDLRAFTMSERFDAVVCTGDTLNHLLEESELHSALQSIHDAVAPGGALIFDTSNLLIYTSVLWNCVDSKAEADTYTMTCNARFDPRSNIGRLAMHVVEETAMTTKDLRGTIRQRYWTDEELRAALTEVGFHVESARTFHPFDAPNEYPWLVGGKTLWVATRS